MWINEEVEREICERNIYKDSDIVKLQITEEIKSLIKDFISEIKPIKEKGYSWSKIDAIEEITLNGKTFKVIQKGLDLIVEKPYYELLNNLKWELRDFENKIWKSRLTILLVKNDKLIDIVNQKIILGYEIKGLLTQGEIKKGFVLAQVYVDLRGNQVSIKNWNKRTIKYNAVIEPVNIEEIKELIDSKLIKFEISKEGKFYKGEIKYNYENSEIFQTLLSANIISVEDLNIVFELKENYEKLIEILNKYEAKIKKIAKEKLGIEHDFNSYVFDIDRIKIFEEILKGNPNFVIGYNKKNNELQVYKSTKYGYIVA